MEIPRAQRCIARPSVETVAATVAEVLNVPLSDITDKRGGLPRMLVAMLASVEGLVVLREIAKHLTLRSKGHISNLVRRCTKRARQEADVSAWARECLERLRPPSMALG